MKKVTRIHFIGIGGAGMNGLAELFINMGYEVTGSDLKESENTERIRKLGGKIFTGHDAKNIKGAGAVVYSNAVPHTNPEVVEARRLKLPVIPRAAMLNEVMRLKTGIAIAGAHGKTTTTSMLAQVFEEAKLDPTYIIGGLVKSIGAHAKAGKGKYVIAEACEAYGSFLHLSPVIAGVTNIDNDHLDYYKNLDSIKDAFVSFVNKVPFYGAVYLNGDDANVRSITERVNARTFFFGFNKNNDLYATGMKVKGFAQVFNVVKNNKSLGQFTLGVPGLHNVQNALLVISIALDMGIKPAVVKKALAKFKNVKRRFNMEEAGGIMVVDDYAHHPSEVEKVLSTARSLKPKKVIAVFQPHLFSRTVQLYKDFAQVFSKADCVILDNIYPSREIPVPGVTSALIKDSMAAAGYKHCYWEHNWQGIIERVKKTAKKGDMVIIMGAGSIYEIKEKILRELK
jgi:UDP-N-acetylmuramate--alanine ligase